MDALSLSCDTVVTGETVRRLREELQLSQRQFAEIMGIPPTTVASHEQRHTHALNRPTAIMYRLFIERTYNARVRLMAAREEIYTVFKK